MSNQNFLQDKKTHITVPKQYQEAESDNRNGTKLTTNKSNAEQDQETVKMVVNGKNRTNLIMINGP